MRTAPMSKYDLVIFDLDGTILDTSVGILSAVKHTICQMDYAMVEDDILSTFIGPPIQDSFARVYGSSGEVLQEIATIFREQYKSKDLLKAMPYEGIYEVLQELLDRNIVMAVATYKREDYALTLLKHFQFDRYATIMHGADHWNRLKKQDIIQMCIEEAGIADYQRVVMVGDTLHDEQGAKLLGIDFIGVSYGFGFKTAEELAMAHAVGFANKPLDLLSMI